MAAETLAPCVARISAAMMLTKLLLDYSDLTTRRVNEKSIDHSKCFGIDHHNHDTCGWSIMCLVRGWYLITSGRHFTFHGKMYLFRLKLRWFATYDWYRIKIEHGFIYGNLTHAQDTHKFQYAAILIMMNDILGSLSNISCNVPKSKYKFLCSPCTVRKLLFRYALLCLCLYIYIYI